MAIEIIRGIRKGAVRGIFSGTEGIGKSTLAARIPGALIIDTEESTNQIDCARVVASDWRAVEHATKDLLADTQGFTAMVYDSVDWLERALIEHMLKQSGKKSIEDYGFGKGYTILQENFSRFLALADQFIAKGVHVVFVAHTKTVRVSPPDQTDGYDRYELKLSKQVGPLLKEWSELYLFCNYKIQIVEGSDGRLKAQGGTERVMYANRCAAWDAKNRFRLPNELPMDFASISGVFSGAVTRATPVTEVEATEVKQETPAPEQEAATTEPRITASQLATLETYQKNSVGRPMVEDALERADAVGIDELTHDEAAALITAIQAAMNAATEPKAKVVEAPKPKLPAAVSAWLDTNAAKVNAYLLSIKWITTGQGWADMTEEKLNALVDKADKFAKQAGIPAMGAAK